MNITKNLSSEKQELLHYFRSRYEEFKKEIYEKYGVSQFKKRASAVNQRVQETKELLLTALLQFAMNEGWSNKEKLEAVLMINYTSYVAMIEARNEVWPYDYMSFSRRIGELWEPFCKLCFQYPINDLQLFVPPLFSEVRQNMRDEVVTYIQALNLSVDEKKELNSYYDKVWKLVDSGDISLEMDLHFIHDSKKYVVDFKSGFASNEKGNTNRLLLVASVYKGLGEEFKCVLLVRANEGNNHYFETLKNSGVWSAYSGETTYDEIKKYTGFDIKEWVVTNIDWDADLNAATLEHFADKALSQYLSW